MTGFRLQSGTLWALRGDTPAVRLIDASSGHVASSRSRRGSARDAIDDALLPSNSRFMWAFLLGAVTTRRTASFYVIVLIATAFAAGLWTMAAMMAEPLLRGLPIGVAVGLVITVHCFYHLLRALQWRRRRRAEQVALVELSIPDDVKVVTAYPAVRELDDEQKRVMRMAPDHQGRYRATGIKIAALPGLAVVFLRRADDFLSYRGGHGDRACLRAVSAVAHAGGDGLDG